MGILWGIQPDMMRDSRQIRGHCNQLAKKDHGCLEAKKEQNRLESVPSYKVQIQTCIDIFFLIVVWLVYHDNKIFSLKLCSWSFPFFVSLSWRRLGLFSLTLHWQPLHSHPTKGKLLKKPLKMRSELRLQDLSGVFTEHSFHPGQPRGPDLPELRPSKSEVLVLVEGSIFDHVLFNGVFF